MSPLGELIADRIRTGGPISFAEFMELSLYHPEHGYYARAAQRTGRAGDFFTSVDVGPVFGELIAKQFAEMWRILGSSDSPAGAPPSPFFDIVEAGAGNGRLSRDILDAAARNDPAFYAAIRLSLVEQSPTARAAQAGTLGPHAARLHHSASSLGGLPEPIRGVVFANELLDALPTHAVAMTENGLREVHVDYRDGRFVECLNDLSTPRIAEYLSRAGASLAAGWRAEVNLAAEDWVRTAARSLREGFLVMIDYGHEEAELYGAPHSAGTLTMFKQHTTEFDLQEPGSYDITAHVDLSAVRRAAEHEGMQLLGRLDQTYFLMGLGLDELQAMSNNLQNFEPAALQRRLALKTLMLPGGLGSTHKVLIFGKDVGAPRLLGVAYRERIT
jgi:SAM-dependent MidA family methyltransferase